MIRYLIIVLLLVVLVTGESNNQLTQVPTESIGSAESAITTEVPPAPTQPNNESPPVTVVTAPTQVPVAPTETEPPPSTLFESGSLAIERIRIPRFQVDASVIILGIDEQGIMEAPDGPWEVAWYDFTKWPGLSGNAVFAGHVDSRYDGVPGPAVFWNLKDLGNGDLIEVEVDGDVTYRYHVTEKWVVNGDTSGDELNQIIGRTENEVITLITCGGTFDAETRHYNMRTIIRAERVG